VYRGIAGREFSIDFEVERCRGSAGSAGGDAACPQPLVVGVAEAERVAGDELDHAVDGFVRGVAVTGVEERGDLGPQRSTGVAGWRTSGMSESVHQVRNFQRALPTWWRFGCGGGRGEEGVQVLLHQRRLCQRNSKPLSP
jgi:hypothetical protein